MPTYRTDGQVLSSISIYFANLFEVLAFKGFHITSVADLLYVLPKLQLYDPGNVLKLFLLFNDQSSV
jgi:hypothetical protein